MTKTWLSLLLGASLTFSGAAVAADRTVVGVGTGAVAGAVVAGPVGAVIGAVAGGFIGSSSGGARPRYRRRARYSAHRRSAENGAAVPGRAPIRTTSSAAFEQRPVSEVSSVPAANARRWSEPN